MFSVFENLQVFFRKKNSFFQKPNVLNVFRTQEHKWIAKRIWKKTCEVRRFRKISKRFFFQDIYLFFRKSPKSECFENSRAIITLLEHILDEISQVKFFLETYEGFNEHSIFFFRKKSFFNVLSISWAIKQFEMHSIEKLAKLAFFRSYQALFGKKTSFILKKIRIWTFENP